MKIIARNVGYDGDRVEMVRLHTGAIESALAAVHSAVGPRFHADVPTVVIIICNLIDKVCLMNAFGISESERASIRCMKALLERAAETMPWVPTIGGHLQVKDLSTEIGKSRHVLKGTEVAYAISLKWPEKSWHQS